VSPRKDRTAGSDYRRAYVGEGTERCHRSAQIDREEADTLDALDPRRDQLHALAEAWERQTDSLASGSPRRRPESERRFHESG
jgi:hypothetical protein